MNSIMIKSILRYLAPSRISHLDFPIHARSIGSDSSGYDGDGKTIVSVVNEEERQRTLVDSYSKMGFRLNSGIFFIGPVAVFPQMVLQWDVVSARDINPRSLSLFWLLEPKIEVLVIGVGDSEYLSHMDMKTRLFLKSKGLNVEVLPTPEAVASFNFMNVDYRNVAAALIPPKRNYIYTDEAALDQYSIKGTLFEPQNSAQNDIEKRQWKMDKKGSEALDKFLEDKEREEQRNKRF